MDLQVERSVPKFLQPYAHLLDRGKKRPRPQLDDATEADDDDVGDAVSQLVTSRAHTQQVSASSSVTTILEGGAWGQSRHAELALLMCKARCVQIPRCNVGHAVACPTFLT